MPTMPISVTVTWNAGTNDVLVRPDPIRAFEATAAGEDAQITWRPANGTFEAGAFAWKNATNPGWVPNESSGNLVSPVFDPAGQQNWFYDITITDSDGVAHTLDPEIQNEEPPIDIDKDKDKDKDGRR